MKERAACRYQEPPASGKGERGSRVGRGHPSILPHPSIPPPVVANGRNLHISACSLPASGWARLVDAALRAGDS